MSAAAPLSFGVASQSLSCLPMAFSSWQFIMVALAGWMNRQQQEVIEYLKEENRVLREKLGHKRIILNDDQRRRLAARAAKLGKDLLAQVGTLFSPETLLTWHRKLIAAKYNGQRGKRGPEAKKANSIRKLVLDMCKENPSWGYGRIYGELRKLGYDVHWQTVRRVMLDAGLLPDPERPYKTSWKTFIQAHWEIIAACDFFTVEALGLKGLQRYLIFFVIDVASRRVEIAGIHEQPCETEMVQYARNLTDSANGFLKGKRVLIHDRDPLYTNKFTQTLRAAGVRCLKTPKQSPNLNAYAERFVWSIKHECIDKMIFFGEHAVRHVVTQYAEHYNKERPHKGLDYRRPVEPETPPPEDGKIVCRERLGGLLRSYERAAA